MRAATASGTLNQSSEHKNNIGISFTFAFQISHKRCLVASAKPELLGNIDPL